MVNVKMAHDTDVNRVLYHDVLSAVCEYLVIDDIVRLHEAFTELHAPKTNNLLRRIAKRDCLTDRELQLYDLNENIQTEHNKPNHANNVKKIDPFSVYVDGVRGIDAFKESIFTQKSDIKK
jgi:hypothetical protein